MFDSIDDWLIIAVVAGILFYGSSKIPQLAHSMGRAVGEFKKGRLEVDREIKAEQASTAAAPSSPTPPAVATGAPGPGPGRRPQSPS